MQIFIEPPPDAQRKESEGTGKEKGRERGIWDCCMLLSGVLYIASPHHLSPILHSTSPSCGFGYQDWRHSGEPPPFPITHTPFDNFEAIAVDL